ncbi:hypothetical protein [uncultured Erythrobacter sp.]|uniref:hypothetical protein n=1 Tax=uncultured Erythrobacter sp. TaxID=263913 RepID=UPI00261CF568|nr:hypothetical protein [uncultured Erythrobacter sp.]
MSNSDKTPPESKGDWEGFREIDRAIAEDRLTSYTWEKTWADPWGKAGLVLFGLLFAAFVIFVIIYDGLI